MLPDIVYTGILTNRLAKAYRKYTFSRYTHDKDFLERIHSIIPKNTDPYHIPQEIINQGMYMTLSPGRKEDAISID